MNKQFYFLTVCSLVSLFSTAQNVGIGTTTPNGSLQFANQLENRKIVLYENTNNDHQFYGFGINSSTLRYQVDAIGADHVFFAAANGSNSNELFRIKGNGNVGIGTISPALAGLTVDKKVGATHAVFGSNTTGLAIESSLPGIGFNTYFDATRRAITTGFGGYIGVNSSGGGMTLAVSSSSSTTGNPITVNPAIYIKPDGSVGLSNTAPNAPLQFSNAVQNRKIVLYEASNNDHMFYGFGVNGFTLRYQVPAVSDNHVFYSGIQADGSNELFRINGNGNVGIGVSDPVYKLDVGAQMRIRSTPGNGAGLWLNNNANNTTPAFIGMQADNLVGFHGTGGANWGLTMNTQNAALNLNGNPGQTNQLITSNSNAAASWKGLADLITTLQSEDAVNMNSSPGELPLTNATINFTVTQPAKVIAFYRTRTDLVCLFGPCPSAWKLRIYLNGNPLDEFHVYANKRQFGLADDVTQGPTVFEVPAGSHSLTFTCQRDWELPTGFVKPVIFLLGH